LGRGACVTLRVRRKYFNQMPAEVSHDFRKTESARLASGIAQLFLIRKRVRFGER